MTFAKTLTRCTCKACWILQRVLCVGNLVIRLIKCIHLNCILMPSRYAEVGRCNPKHCQYRTTGESHNAVAARYNIHRSMISRLWQRYQQSGSTNDGLRSGRPCITNPVEDRYIRVFQRRHKAVTASQTASNIPGLRRYLNRQYAIVFMSMVNVPDDVILVLF